MLNKRAERLIWVTGNTLCAVDLEAVSEFLEFLIGPPLKVVHVILSKNNIVFLNLWTVFLRQEHTL